MNIGIVGLGLIGGSLGLDLRAQGHKVLGVSRREETCQQAIPLGVVDDASVDLNILAGTDVVFICTPIAAIAPTVEQLIPYLTPETIITDAGSVKAPVVEAIAPLWQNFVGGHPMAGKSESGLEVAQAQLFAGKPYVLTPVETTPLKAVKTVEEIVNSLGVKISYCRPEDHDRAVAWISHLPVMVSGSLIAACMGESDPNVLELAQKLASSGFRDTSRVGGGNPELGLMMARYNQEALVRSLHQYRQTLDQLILKIEQADWSSLEEHLKKTKQARPKFNLKIK
ncbi:arogenate dehydrogenase (NADP) [Crinalium epipsammum PCC 9333]|uniref:Arogenate dehydrogenase (NADP) n=1 Tax=Crinalium epipsammum PCC 9333 TaxID=1173022 RepID=K9VZS2_9CYAN|nr:prephenate/arogenate dehydrogenase [Crinalium epipsammum]AFZ12660.1 arogenate dehydrogenase (NADP) [Crinalium epipsammum PCC 9333]